MTEEHTDEYEEIGVKEEDLQDSLPDLEEYMSSDDEEEKEAEKETEEEDDDDFDYDDDDPKNEVVVLKPPAALLGCLFSNNSENYSLSEWSAFLEKFYDGKENFKRKSNVMWPLLNDLMVTTAATEQHPPSTNYERINHETYERIGKEMEL